jgi:hypothetical protein
LAQPPYKVDALQVEPAAAGSRLISRDPATGGLRFVDPSLPSGVLLSDLVGFATATGTLLVGPGGYATVQDAVDEAPLAQPVILVSPGVYTENLVIDKDVEIVGLGTVVFVNDVAGPTVHITETSEHTPRHVILRDLIIANNDVGGVCVHVDGSNTFASGSFTLITSPLAAGDILTIGGVTLTGVAGARTPGSDNFNATLTPDTALVAEIVAAINDPANSFGGLVTAIPGPAQVFVISSVSGVVGNGVTLDALTTPPGNVLTSGPTLVGGGGVDSEVGLDEVLLSNVLLQATGVGGLQLVSEFANNVNVIGGSWKWSSTTSMCMVSQTARFHLDNVRWVNDVQVAYDNTFDQPAIKTSEWSMRQVGRAQNLLLNLIGEGSTTISDCPEIGQLTHNGDRTLFAYASRFGDVVIEDTVSATLVQCSRSTLGGGGTPTVAESSAILISNLVAAVSDTVSFDREQPDNLYTVLVDVPALGVTSNVIVKGTTSFTVSFSGPVTGTVYYTVLRQL